MSDNRTPGQRRFACAGEFIRDAHGELPGQPSHELLRDVLDTFDGEVLSDDALVGRELAEPVEWLMLVMPAAAPAAGPYLSRTVAEAMRTQRRIASALNLSDPKWSALGRNCWASWTYGNQSAAWLLVRLEGNGRLRTAEIEALLRGAK